ncbi:phage tail assembly protein T [Streptomyces albipurpureus]|uniref:Minor tail T domain-containing protein n=1 Tax=Streptomyces albipurpureus TaxID=2897419 RepID=A0ABT0UPN2_9ACTN|nr:hypothetical protein [Streptomyces sp. CWNU-1]MCM2390201.1 hypothetical protein [Streptomyces sp. CWNU-1]
MDEVLARHTSAQLTEWMAYERVTGPLGPERLDVLFSILTATVANTARGKGQRAKEPKDFLPEWDQSKPGPGWEEMLTAVKQMNSRMGGTDLTNGGGGDHECVGPAAGRGRHQRRGSDGWRERRS